MHLSHPPSPPPSMDASTAESGCRILSDDRLIPPHSYAPRPGSTHQNSPSRTPDASPRRRHVHRCRCNPASWPNSNMLPVPLSASFGLLHFVSKSSRGPCTRPCSVVRFTYTCTLAMLVLPVAECLHLMSVSIPQRHTPFLCLARIPCPPHRRCKGRRSSYVCTNLLVCL